MNTDDRFLVLVIGAIVAIPALLALAVLAVGRILGNEVKHAHRGDTTWGDL